MIAKSKNVVILPDGEYEGVCTNQYAKVKFNDIFYRFEIESNVRIKQLPCKVTVINSLAYISA